MDVKNYRGMRVFTGDEWECIEEYIKLKMKYYTLK